MEQGEIPAWLEGKASARHWKRIGFRPRFGICTPLASVRSERDFGVGDIGDFYSLVDFASAAGASLLQILPANDMGSGWVPYAAVSAFALDPIYVALDRLEPLICDPRNRAKIVEIGEALNRNELVDFQSVRREKVALLAKAYELMKGQALDEELERFCAQRPWLENYALFSVVRESEGFCSWEEWLPKYGREGLFRVRRERAEDIKRVIFAQWVLEKQWKEALEYAHARGVLLVGDVPILVGRDSADVFEKPELFLLDTSAGAPPDMYCQDGQAWGFPTYNWPRHREDGFAWWRARLQHAERFFDLYRIDHVVGFFRIWTLPKDAKNGRAGRFVPEDESTWGEHGREILQMMLESTHMLPIAEDLGTIPPICRQVLGELGICGLKVQRWERYWEGDGRFIMPTDYPALSVATLSTHDSETFAGWWEAFPSDRQMLYEAAGFQGAAPESLDPRLHAEFVSWFSKAASVFVILMIQDILAPLGLLPGPASRHRINVPGVVNEANWRWRWPVSLERLNEEPRYAKMVREWIGFRA